MQFVFFTSTILANQVAGSVLLLFETSTNSPGLKGSFSAPKSTGTFAGWQLEKRTISTSSLSYSTVPLSEPRTWAMSLAGQNMPLTSDLLLFFVGGHHTRTLLIVFALGFGLALTTFVCVDFVSV